MTEPGRVEVPRVLASVAIDPPWHRTRLIQQDQPFGGLHDLKRKQAATAHVSRRPVWHALVRGFGCGESLGLRRAPRGEFNLRPWRVAVTRIDVGIAAGAEPDAPNVRFPPVEIRFGGE